MADEVEDLIGQLERLQVKQARLMTRLTRATAVAMNEQRRDPANREFKMGDQVRVRNPGPQQPTVGIITRITKSRIRVTGANGTSATRAFHNILPKEDDED
jgi:transcription antitermination factor NusG